MFYSVEMSWHGDLLEADLGGRSGRYVSSTLEVSLNKVMRSALSQPEWAMRLHIKLHKPAVYHVLALKDTRSDDGKKNHVQRGSCARGTALGTLKDESLW